VPELRILTEHFGEKDVRSIDGYIENADGYSAVRKAIEGGMEPDAVLAEVDASGCVAAAGRASRRARRRRSSRRATRRTS
jgi:NADH:ubiquinone oxidoreductase subunit F (NADH-binding)